MSCVGNLGRVETKSRVTSEEASELTSGDKCPILGHGVGRRKVTVNVKPSEEV